MKIKVLLIAATALLLPLTQLFADSEKKSADANSMPMDHMGAPKEIKDMASMIGKWKAHTKYKMSFTDTAWTESDGEMTYEYILDSCAILIHFKSEFMGMTYKGMGVITYSRDLQKYQQYWLDNMRAAPSLYEGTKDPATNFIVYTGTDVEMGQTIYTKTTVHTKDKNNCVLEFDQSLDGKSFMRTMEISQTKM